MFSQLFFGSSLWEINSKQAGILALDTSPGYLSMEHGSPAALQIPPIYGKKKLELAVHPPSLAPAGLQSKG